MAARKTRVPTTPGRPVPKRSVGPAVGQFFRKRLRHHKGPKYREPFTLEPWQENPDDLTGDLDLIYEVDEHGQRVWLDVGYGIARGNGKSPVVAGCGGIELLSRRDSPEIVVGSGSRAQAGHVFDPIKWNVDNGELGRYLMAHAKIIRPRFRDGMMAVLSADGALQHGGSASVGIYDELHVMVTAKQVELIAAIDSSLHKRPFSWSWWISTAGFNKDTLLGERYDKALRYPDVWQGDGIIICRDYDSRSLMIWRGVAPDADIEDPAVWRSANPASWLTTAALRRQFKKLRENDFRRLHLNQWTRAEGAWLPKGAWSKCTNGLYVPDSVLQPPREDFIPEGSEVFVGVDVGLKKDSASITTAWPHEPEPEVDDA